MFKTPTSFTPKLVIEKVLQKTGDECKGWAMTEVHEKGDGVWSKVCVPCPGLCRRMGM